MNGTPGIDVVEQLIDAVNRHDIDAVADQFADAVRSETPAHPSRSFVGRDQVRRNWSQILGSITDLRATMVASATGSGATPGSQASGRSSPSTGIDPTAPRGGCAASR